LGDLLTEAAHDLPAVAIVEREEENDEPAGREPAERAVPLDQQRIGAAPSRGDGSSAARGAAADDQHFGFGEHGRPPRRLFDGRLRTHEDRGANTAVLERRGATAAASRPASAMASADPTSASRAFSAQPPRSG